MKMSALEDFERHLKTVEIVHGPTKPVDVARCDLRVWENSDNERQELIRRIWTLMSGLVPDEKSPLLIREDALEHYSIPDIPEGATLLLAFEFLWVEVRKIYPKDKYPHPLELREGWEVVTVLSPD